MHGKCTARNSNALVHFGGDLIEPLPSRPINVLECDMEWNTGLRAKSSQSMLPGLKTHSYNESRPTPRSSGASSSCQDDWADHALAVSEPEGPTA